MSPGLTLGIILIMWWLVTFIVSNGNCATTQCTMVVVQMAVQVVITGSADDDGSAWVSGISDRSSVGGVGNNNLVGPVRVWAHVTRWHRREEVSLAFTFELEQ